MSNARDRQQRHDDDDIDEILARMRARKGSPNRVHQRPRRQPVAVKAEPSALLKRHVEPIITAEHKDPKTGELQCIVQTHRFVCLVEVMARDKKNPLPMQYHRAWERLMELHLIASGRSQGVSSYGEYFQASPPSQRSLTTDKKLSAARQFEAAIQAMWATPCADGRLAWNRELMTPLWHAMVFDDKSIDKKSVGSQITHFIGAGQQQAIQKRRAHAGLR